MPVHVGANSLKKPHHIVILRFSEVVKDHANCSAEHAHTQVQTFTIFQILAHCVVREGGDGRYVGDLFHIPYGKSERFIS